MYVVTKQSSGNGVAYIGELLFFHTVSAFHTQHITYLKLSPHTLAVRILWYELGKGLRVVFIPATIVSMHPISAKANN